MKLTSLSQAGLSFQVDLKFSCEQNNFFILERNDFSKSVICIPCDPLAIETIKTALKVSQLALNVRKQCRHLPQTISIVLIPEVRTPCFIFSDRSENVIVRGRQISRQSQISERPDRSELSHVRVVLADWQY